MKRNNIATSLIIVLCLFLLVATGIFLVSFYGNSEPELHVTNQENNYFSNQYFSFSVPKGWTVETEKNEEGYSLVELVLGSNEKISISGKDASNLDVTSEEALDVFEKEVLRAQKEYEQNQTGEIPEINRIEYKDTEAIRYTINIFESQEKITEVDTVYFFKNDVTYMVRLENGVSSDLDKQVFEELLSSIEIK